MSKILVIGGTMRSGTTYLNALINSHPEVSVLPDKMSWFWKKCFQHYGEMDSDYLFEKCLYEQKDFIEYKLSKDQLDQISSGKVFEAFKDRGYGYKALYFSLIDAWYPSVIDHSTLQYLGDKSTHNHYQYNRILEYFPEAKVIHIVRHPLDIYRSHKKRLLNFKERTGRFAGLKKMISKYVVNKRHYSTGVRLWTPFEYSNEKNIIFEWIESVRIAFELKNKFPDRIQLVRFEDLKENESSFLGEIADFLTIDNAFSTQSLVDGKGREFVRNTSFSDQSDRNSIVSNAEEEWLRNLTKKFLAKLGYS
tara:strand:- start:1755 stop:2675 length:921 start_codon:yes stop_codon:yes gene_type:complete